MNLDPEGQRYLDESRQLTARIVESLPSVVPGLATTMNSKLPFKAMSLRELLIHRVAELAQAALDLFDNGHSVAAAVIVRALIETVATVIVVHKRVGRFLEDADANSLDEFLTRGLVGSRTTVAKDGSPPDRETVVALNTLTMIDHAEGICPGIRGSYEILCEYAHPNWSGTLGSYGQFDKETIELRLGSGRTSPARTGVGAMSAALLLFEHFYNESGELILKMNQQYAAQTRGQGA